MNITFFFEMKAIQVYYEGRVQGVGFRWTVKHLAKEYDVSGTVRNLLDGRVELIVQGDAAEVTNFLEAIRTSSLAAHIATETTQDIPHTSRLRGFQIVS